MGKLFQNNVQSEIVAGHFGEDSLEGLYLGGDYFQIKKRQLITVYYGNIYSDTEHSDPLAYFGGTDGNRTITVENSIGNISDADFADMVLAADGVPYVDSTSLEVESPYDFDILYDVELSDQAYGWHFYAIPNELATETINLIEKQTSGKQTPLCKRVVEINGVDYLVLYGFGDAVPLTVICKEGE